MIQNVIREFRNQYAFLSNFYPTQITYKGLTYKNAEAAFQAQKCSFDAEKRQFCDLDGKNAKRRGRHVKLRKDWNNIKLTIMHDIVKAKFEQNPKLLKQLLYTGNTKLIEGNYWHDTFWGIDIQTNVGKNNLGKILMCVRDELKNKQKG